MILYLDDMHDERIKPGARHGRIRSACFTCHLNFTKLLMQLKRMILVDDTWSLKFVTAAVSFPQFLVTGNKSS